MSEAPAPPTRPVLELRDPPGFRFYPTDALVLAVGAAGVPALRGSVGSFAWVVPLVVGHFFLFCNVFRVRTRYELAWAAVALANLMGHLATGAFAWPRVLGIQLAMTALVLGLELRSPEYKGLGWGRLNPDLAWRPRGS